MVIAYYMYGFGLDCLSCWFWLVGCYCFVVVLVGIYDWLCVRLVVGVVGCVSCLLGFMFGLWNVLGWV